jgi:hypothetical protein
MEEKNVIELVLTYQGKSILVETNPYNTVERFIEETKKQAKENPVEMFNMPELDMGNNPMYYFLTRVKNGQTEILKPKNKQKENQTLDDYEVKDNDELIIQSKPIAGCVY